VTCTREFVMDWFAWYVTVGIPVLVVLMALGLNWWDGYERHRSIRLLNYRLVNTQISESGLNDSRGLAGACAKGFSEHLHRPST
jgi:hypothetical protein